MSRPCPDRYPCAKHSQSESHRRKVAASHTGPRHPLWKGDDAGTDGVHSWLDRWHPKTGVCSECGAEGKTDRAFLRHPEPHTRNPDDYEEMCRSCHVLFDLRNGTRKPRARHPSKSPIAASQLPPSAGHRARRHERAGSGS